MKTQTITIIGLGRVGASIGLALKNSPLDVKVIGHDPDAEKGKIAKDELQAIDQTEWSLAKAARKADILIITSQIAELEEVLQVIGSEIQAHTLVIDLSNLKRLGLDWAKLHLQQGHYVGAMPVLAAPYLTDGRSHPSAATPDLFKNSTFCLMPSAKVDSQAVETAVNFGLLLGASPYFVDPDEYDSLIQGSETLPGLVAVAMFNAMHQASGWRDMLRFAGLPFALMTLPLQNDRDIPLLALQNKQATLRWLDATMEELKVVRRLVSEENDELLTAVAKQSSIEREKWLNSREENNWDERKSPTIRHRGLGERMFGGFARWGEADE